MKTSITNLRRALLILLICLMGMAKAMAQSFTVGDLNFSINSDGITVTVTGPVNGTITGSLDIPESVTNEGTTYIVTSIGDEAFLACNGFTGNLTIGNSITTIGKYAFYGCYGFTGSLTIPNSVTTIGLDAFRYCSGFTAVHYNASNCSDPAVFESPFGDLGSCILEIGENVERIPSAIFKGCSNFTGCLTIPNSVVTIGNSAFSGCSGFTGQLAISNSLTTIGSWAFFGCSGFTGNLTIPSSTTSIEINPFSGCLGLETIIVDAENTVYDSRDSCNAIINTSTNELISGCQNTIIPNSVTSIGDYAFYNCTNLTSMTLPNTITSIGARAFYNCSGLSGSLTIPNSVTMIGGYAFYGCSGFTEVHYNAINCENVSLSGFQGCSGTLTIGDNVERIPSWMFRNCSGFTGTLTIPSSVSWIGEGAFSGCSGFLEVQYNAVNCANISFEYYNTYYPFEGCCGILIIGENVERIPDYMFSQAAFTGSLIIPNSVTTIGDYAFLNCSGFTGCLTIPNSVTEIGMAAFTGCSGFMGDLIIPNSITLIPYHAFYNCNGLTSFSIPNSVTTIELDAFKGTGWFNNQSNGVLYLDRCCLGQKNYNSIDSLNIQEGTRLIAVSSFSSLSSLTTITIPNSVTNIGNLAFKNCYNLISLSCYAETPPIISFSTFLGVPKNIPIYVPVGTIEAYQTANCWNEFTNYQEIENNYLDYISDGLIMQFDGIQNTRNGHSTTTNVWEDLVGNYDLAVTNYNSYTWENNHFIGLGDGGYLNTGQTWQYFNSLNDDITFEIVTYIDCDKTSPSWRGLVGWHIGNDGSNCQNDQGYGRMETLGELPVSDADDQIATVSYTKNNGSFLNGVWKTNVNTIPSGINSNQIVVFGNSHAQCRGWNDSIYCIRMYNRTLTPEEIAYNHSIDVIRFGAGNGGSTPLGDFTYMSPTDNYPFTSLPIIFSWDAVSSAQNYDLYLWNANDPTPEEPYVSGMTNGYYRCTSLPNHQTYKWFVKAYNPNNAITSTIRTFTLDVEPAINVNMSNIDFGEVTLNHTASTSLNIEGVVLEDIIQIQLIGEDASMFSFTTAFGWDDYTGGSLLVNFTPTVSQYEFHATLVVSSGTLTQSIPLSGSVADIYVFNTYVDGGVYSMNTSIPIHGTVMDVQNNPTANVEVEIGVFVMGMRRSLQATTNASGEFFATFEPMPSESGYYTVNSGRVGNHSTAIHDDFNIPGMSVVTDGYILCLVTQDQPKTDTIQLRNKSNLPLNNIQVSVLSAPEGCSISFMPLSLGGLETADLVFTVNGTELTQGNQYREIKLRVNSNEGASTDFSIWYYCMEPKGILNVAPNNIATTMTKGKSKIVDVMLSNHGTAATGEISINLPEADWLSVVGNSTLPSIAVNDSAFFSLRLSPNEDIQLGQYSGSIAISCEHGEFASLPYQITAVSDSTGTLVVDVTDEYTWNTNGGFGPHLANAEVTLTSYFSLETVAHGYTNEDGIFNVEQLPEGYYKLHVSADRHSEYDIVILIEAGVTNQRDVFVQYQGVTYSWEVIPTEIQDEYTYELNVVYETNVPVPVITIDYSGIHDLEFGESANCNLIFTNHGLISAYETQIYFSPSDEYTFIPLYDIIDTLPAQTTVVVPCYYYRSENEAKESSENCDIHCLSVSIYYCNNDRQMVSARSKPFPLGTYEICFPEDILIVDPIIPIGEIYISPVIPWIDWPICPFCPHIEVDVPPTTEEHFCTPCLEALAKTVAGCVQDPRMCGLINGISNIVFHSSFELSLPDQLSCLFTALGKKIPIIGIIGCLSGACQNLGNCVNIEFHDNSKGNADFIQNTINGLYYSSLYFANELSLVISFFPEEAWDDEENIVEFLDEVKALTNATTGLISENDAQQLASTFIGTSVTYDDIMAFVNRWNRSLEYWSNGYYMISDLPEGYNTDFVQIDTDMINEMLEVEDYFSLLGYENMAVVYSESLEDANTIIGNTSQSNVCAKITVQFSQKMTMTREAFEGTFSVHNGNDENSMEGIGLNFMVKDEDGNDCTNLFQINTTSLSNLTAIDGSGSLGAAMDGMAKILFIPTNEAAPIEPKVYYFGGTFTFIDPYTSDELVYDLFPVDLTVHPGPDLHVDYFMQRDILGDDALTLDKVEPSIPAELGVIINNKGAGVAKNVILETAEPKIVDNEKGLAIDFAMYGASFNGNEAQLGLMAIPFGNIESGRTAVGEWLFTSSLLGHFVSYEAHVIHNNSYGNPNLSLVSHLDIHELIHPIRAYGDLDDGINDFLVNDMADFHDYPDSIYFSHGGRTAVGLVDDIHFDHYVSPQDTVVILTLNPSRVGWNYGVTNDPGSDKYELVSCTRRADNQVIPMNNIWQTFVTLNDGGDPTYENKLHIVDTLSNDNFDYTYTLVYSKKKELLKVEEIIGIPESDFIEYPLESFSVKFSKPIADSTFTYEDMVLKCNNGSNLMNATVDISKIDDDKYDVNIAGLTYQTGYYVLNVNTLNINDTQGYAGYEGKQATWIQVLNGDVFVHINGDQTICDNDAFEPLTSVVVGEYNTLQWKRGGVSITGANGLQYQPSESGIYTLTVAFENGEVLTSNEVTLVSNPINEVYINDEICEGDEYILNDFIMTGLSAGIYNETLYLENLHHCDSIVSAYLVVHESPEVHIQIDTINQNGISFRLTAIGADNYEWSTGETTASIIVSPINPTTFSVVGTNSNGCSDSDEVIVSGGTGINENQTTASAIIFPNPAHNKLFIKTSSAVNAVEIFSITGTLVHKQSSNSDTIEIDVQHISSGMYFIRLIANHSVETMRFVKE